MSGIFYFVVSSLHNAASLAVSTDSCEASVVRNTLPAHVLCLSEPVGRVTQNMGEKACETNRKRSMSVGIAGEAVSCTSKNTKNQLQSTNKICYYLSYEHKCISDANTGGQIRQWKRKPHTLF